MLQNLSSAAVVIGSLRVNSYWRIYILEYYSVSLVSVNSQIYGIVY